MSGTGSLRALGVRRMDFPGVRAGEPSLKRGFIPRSAVTLSHFLQLLHPFASESSAPLPHSHFPLFAAAVAMASLVHPERYQTERRLGTVRRLLGWSAPAHA
jgi:hypothetical protein